MSTIIKPTIGRIVWFRAHSSLPDEQAQAAIICYVHNDTAILIAVFSHAGYTYPLQYVKLIQEGEDTPYGEDYAEWMPYQQNQQAKSDAMTDAENDE